MALSRADRLIKLLGGEENIPKRVPPEASTQTALQAPEKKAKPDYDASSVVNVVKPSREQTSGQLPRQPGEDFWNWTPQRIEPTWTKTSALNSNSTTFDAPYTAADGAVKFRYDKRKDEIAPRGINLCPLIAVTRFCYKFVPPHLSQPLASAFFDAGKIWHREWDLFYIWSPHFETAKPTTFIPEHQLLQLIDEINQAFPDEKITLSDKHREEGLVINFDDFPDSLRPRWLGHSTSRDQIDFWTDHLSPPSSSNMSPEDDRSLEAFRAKMEDVMAIQKNKKNANAAKKHQDALANRQGMVKQLIRARNLLGLATLNEDPLVAGISTMSIPIDPDQFMSSTLGKDVIFISVDIEAWERNQNAVTEVGIAVLDTRDIRGHAPGKNGKNWQQLIRARHLRIDEHKHLVNRDFVPGYPGNFEFGVSEFVGKDDIAPTLAGIFRDPLGHTDPPEGAALRDPRAYEFRPLILLGHDVQQDINYLRRIRFDPLNRNNLNEVMDTATMYRAYTQDPNPTSLSRILYNLDMTAWYAHNAGNDAVYTIWAMLAMCVKSACEGTEKHEEEVKERLEKKKEDAVAQAKERVDRDAEGWEFGEEDGGVALSSVEPFPNIYDADGLRTISLRDPPDNMG